MIQEYIKKVAVAYYAVGAVLMAIGINQLGPVLVGPLFSEETITALIEVLGAISIFVGYLKSNVIVEDTAELQSKVFKKSSFAWNPLSFKL